MSNFSALIATIQANIRQNGNEEITGQVLQDVLEAMVDALGTVAINDLEAALAAEVTNRTNAVGAEATARQEAVAALETAIAGINAKIPAEATSGNKLADKAFVKALTDALQDAVDDIVGDIGNGYVYAGVATPSTSPVAGKVFYLAKEAGIYANFGELNVTAGINVLKYNGSAWSQEQLVSMAEIYRNPLMGYYLCDTVGGTAAKVVTANGYVLPTSGGCVKIKFTEKNTAANPTLNISNTGAKPLYYAGARASASNTWEDGETVVIFYDGTNYIANNVTNIGNALQVSVNAINANIGNGFVFAGIATPSGTPVSGKVFYLAKEAGTYTNFGGLVVTQGINVLKYDGSAWSQEQLIGIDDVPTAGSNNLVKSGGVYDFANPSKMEIINDAVLEEANVYIIKDGTTSAFQNSDVYSINCNHWTAYTFLKHFVSGVAGICFYDNNGNYITGYSAEELGVTINPSQSQYNLKFSVVPPQGSKSIKFSVRKDVGYEVYRNEVINSAQQNFSTVRIGTIESGMAIVKPTLINDATIDTENSFIDKSGTVTSFANSDVYSMPCSYAFAYEFVKHFVSGTAGICFYDGDGNYITGYSASELNVNYSTKFTIVPPYGAVTVKFSVLKTNGYEVYKGFTTNSAMQSLINKDVDGKLEGILPLTLFPITPTLVQENTYIKKDGALDTSLTNCDLYTFQVSQGDSILLYKHFISGNSAICFYDSDNNLIGSGLDGSMLGINYSKPVTLVSPQNSSYAKVAGLKEHKLIIYLSVANNGKQEIATNKIDNVDRLPIVPFNPMDVVNKESSLLSIILNWGFIGDSLTKGQHNYMKQDGTMNSVVDREDYSWGKYLERLFGINASIFARGGATAHDWINESFGWATAKNSPQEAYIISLGVNDYAVPYDAGDYTTDIDISDYNNNADTFIGNYGGIIQRLKSIAPRAKIFVTTMPKGFRDYTDYNTQIRNVATLFTNVYVIDLWNYGVVEGRSSGDFHSRYLFGYHLNAAGNLFTAWMFATYIDWIIRNNYSDFYDVALLGTEYDVKVSYDVSGIVSSGGVGIEGALVAIISGNKVFYTNTDSYGNYRVRFLPAGTYDLYVSHEGYTQYTDSITINDQSIVVNVSLT